MKLTGVSSERLHCPSDGDACLVSLQADTGLAGRAAVPTTTVPALSALVADCLAGEDPRGIVSLWQRLADRIVREDDDWSRAAAALDVALWDLRARMRDEPLWQTLGGDRPRATVSVLVDAPADELAVWGRRQRDSFGITECTWVLNDDERIDARGLRQLADALGRPERPPVIRLRVPSGWSVQRAIDRVTTLERRFDIASVELASGTSPADLRTFSDAVFAAASDARGIASPRQLHPLLVAGAVDIVRIDVMRTGITGALQIADAAFGLELPVAFCQSPGDLAAQLAPALPYFASMDIGAPDGPQPVIRGDIRIEGGRAIAGDAVGNGLRVAPEDGETAT